jgi:hypothetical protein
MAHPSCSTLAAVGCEISSYPASKVVSCASSETAEINVWELSNGLLRYEGGFLLKPSATSTFPHYVFGLNLKHGDTSGEEVTSPQNTRVSSC